MAITDSNSIRGKNFVLTPLPICLPDPPGIQAQRAQGHTKKNRVLRLEPISKLKASLCQMVWRENIKDVVKYSHEKPVIRRLEKLLAA
mgnify:CR=1 FL=1|jgi:hypothetical protein